MARFSDEQIRRYSRQILLREVGGHGQTRLEAARPVLLCHGEVGELTAEYLWRAGVIAPTLLSPTAAAAARLTARLEASGYPGAPAQAITEIALQLVAAAAPGFSLLWLSAADCAGAAADDSGGALLLWAGCRGTCGVVGQGVAALQHTVAEPAAVAGCPSESGALAMVVGSALALLALQRILGIGPLLGEQPVWQLDLTSTALPGWR